MVKGGLPSGVAVSATFLAAVRRSIQGPREPSQAVVPSLRYDRDVDSVVFIGVLRAIRKFGRSIAVLAVVVGAVHAFQAMASPGDSPGKLGYRYYFWVFYFLLFTAMMTVFVSRFLRRYFSYAQELDRSLTGLGIRRYNRVANRWARRPPQLLFVLGGALAFSVILAQVKDSGLDAATRIVVAAAGASLALGGYWVIAAIEMPFRAFARGSIRLPGPSPADAPVVRKLISLYLSLFWASFGIVLVGLVPVFVATGGAGREDSATLHAIRALLVGVSVVFVVPLAVMPHIPLSLRVREAREDVIKKFENSGSTGVLRRRFGSRDGRLMRGLEYAVAVRSPGSTVRWPDVIAVVSGVLGVVFQILALRGL